MGCRLVETLALLALFGLAQGKVIIKDLAFETDKTYVELKAELKTADEKISLHADSSVKQDLGDTVHISLLVSVLMEGSFMPLLRLEPIPICKFLNVPNKPAVMKLAFMILKSFGDIPEECPIKKGNYSIHDAEIDENFMIPMAPSGTLQVEFWTYIKENDSLKQIIQASFKTVIEQPDS